MATTVLTQLYFCCVQYYLVLNIYFLESVRVNMPNIKYHVVFCPFSFFCVFISYRDKKLWTKITAYIVAAAYSISFLSMNVVHFPIKSLVITFLYLGFVLLAFNKKKKISEYHLTTTFPPNSFFINLVLGIVTLVVLTIVIFCNIFIMP